MRRSTKLNIGLLLGTVVAFGSGGFLAFAGGDKGDSGHGVFARAIVSGPGGIEGTVEFSQPPCPGCPTPGLAAPATDTGFEDFPEPTVEVRARITGLAPGAHGFHIHETASCVAPFAGSGGHFDAGPFASSNPVDANHPFHSGDLPNLIVGKNGIGRLRHTTSRITLSPGPLTVFDADGSAVIVHLNPDRGMTGVVGASGGPRVACGIIELDERGEAADDD
jgi:Cu/Zn superoxide dismutase